MSINKESALVDLLELELKHKFNTDLSLREFSAGYGRADLVFARDFKVDSSQAHRPTVVSYNAFHLWATLDGRRRYSKMQIFEMLGGGSRTYARSVLNALLENRYILQHNDRFLKNSDLDNPIRRTIAIEVKLYDHKNGIIQARRYQYFADESYLAILKRAADKIDREVLRKYNIGLIVFDPDCGHLQIISPKRNTRQLETVGKFAKELMLSSWSREITRP